MLEAPPQGPLLNLDNQKILKYLKSNLWVYSTYLTILKIDTENWRIHFLSVLRKVSINLSNLQTFPSLPKVDTIKVTKIKIIIFMFWSHIHSSIHLMCNWAMKSYEKNSATHSWPNIEFWLQSNFYRYCTFTFYSSKVINKSLKI